MRHVLTAAVVLLATFGLYSMGGDAAEQIPGPIGGVFRQPHGSHAPVTLPALVNFQGRLVVPATGDPVADGGYSVRFSIWNASSAGAEQWNETKNITTAGGVFSTLLGSVTPLPATVFAGSPRFLEVKVGADAPMTPRQQFTSVAYAYFAGGANLANDAELLDGVNSTQFLRSDISATQNASLTVAGNFTVNQAATLGNGVGSDPVTVNDSLTVNQGTQLGDSLSDPTTITGPLETLTSATVGADLAVTGDLVVDGNNIDNGIDTPDLRLDPDADGAGSLLLGGSTSAGDDVQIPDGGLCVGASGCNALPADGSLQVDGGASIRMDTTFDQDITVGADPAFDSTAQVVFGNQGRGFRHDATDVASPDLEILGFLATEMEGSLCVAAVSGQISDGTCASAINGRIGVIVADEAIEANKFDLAERFAADDDVAPGDLVTFASDGARVRRSDGTPYDSRVAGIVSSDPGFTLGWAKDGDVPVALQGRVPLNVSLENGPIAPGDYLTSSSTPGYAMKATEPGATVGVALEAFDDAAAGRGQVLTFVSRGDSHLASTVRALETRIAALESGASRGEAAPEAAATTVTGERMSSPAIVLAIGGLLAMLAAIVGASGIVRGRRGAA